MVRELHEAGVVCVEIDPSKIMVDPRRSIKRCFGINKRILEVNNAEDI